MFLGSFWYFEPIINELRLGGFKKPRNMSKCRTVYSNLGQHPDFVHEIRDRPRKLGLSLPFLNLCQPFNSWGLPNLVQDNYYIPMTFSIPMVNFIRLRYAATLEQFLSAYGLHHHKILAAKKIQGCATSH